MKCLNYVWTTQIFLFNFNVKEISDLLIMEILLLLSPLIVICSDFYTKI